MKSLWGKVSVGLLGWVLGAVTATAVGLWALSAIDFGLATRTTTSTSNEQIDDSSSPPTTAASPSPNASSSAAQQVERVLSADSGTVTARCTPAGAYLVSWSPAQGYRADDVRRGPAASAKVKFESGKGEYTLTVTCPGGVPELTVTGHAEDHR